MRGLKTIFVCIIIFPLLLSAQCIDITKDFGRGKKAFAAHHQMVYDDAGTGRHIDLLMAVVPDDALLVMEINFYIEEEEYDLEEGAILYFTFKRDEGGYEYVPLETFAEYYQAEYYQANKMFVAFVSNGINSDILKRIAKEKLHGIMVLCETKLYKLRFDRADMKNINESIKCLVRQMNLHSTIKSKQKGVKK